MGAPSPQVQSPQSSAPASKGAGVSPSTPAGSGKASMSAISGQPTMGQPNVNGNSGLAPVNANFVAPNDGVTNSNPYPNTIGNMGSVAGGINGSPYQDLPNQPNAQPMAKGGGGGQGNGKGIASAAGTGKAINDPMGMIENTYHPNAGPQGPGSSY